jgi:hypothetical protein
MLQETRMVLIEKAAKAGHRTVGDAVWHILGRIDVEIEDRKQIGLIGAYIPLMWLRNKKVKKVLESNGYEILDSLHQNDIDNGYIIKRNSNE